jgi:hypothetical protein
MERAQSDESGQRCGGTVPILGARHEHKCQLGDAWAEIFSDSREVFRKPPVHQETFLQIGEREGFPSVRPREERSDETATHHLFPA